MAEGMFDPSQQPTVLFFDRDDFAAPAETARATTDCGSSTISKSRTMLPPNDSG
jgi:hypothetical protein